MRIAIVFLTACSLHVAAVDADDTCTGEAPPGSCQCSNGTWFCSTCPFGEGDGPIACTQGQSCSIENWEHGCDCACGSDGWWSCFPETIGSHCPHPPVKDGGIDAPPDAIPIDAAPCSRIEAENIGTHPGWVLLYGALSGGLGLAGTPSTPLVLDFTGTAFGINRELGPNAGPLSISIDDGPATVVPGYQPNTFTFVTIPVASGLTNTVHHATVTCDSPSCSIDFFDVSCP